MTQKELDRIRRIDRWKTLIAERKASEKNLTDFCKEKGVTTASYYYWNNVITKMVLDEADAIGVLKAPATIPEAKAVVEAAQEVTESLTKPDTADNSNCRPATLPRKNSAYMEHLRLIREKAVECALTYADCGHGGINRASLTILDIKCAIKSTQAEASDTMHWLEDKGIVTKNNGRRRGNRDVLITRDQWTAIKDDLLDTDATVAELVLKLPQAEEPISTTLPMLKMSKSNPGSNTYLDKLEKIPPQSLQEKKTSAEHEAGAGYKGFVFDLKNDRLYVSGGADDETIKATAQLLRELELQRSQRRRCTPPAQHPMPPASKDGPEGSSAGSLPS